LNFWNFGGAYESVVFMQMRAICKVGHRLDIRFTLGEQKPKRFGFE
jgi:hypothetical protein